jgi:predicted amidophosphoribosyltransferase
VKRPGRFEHTQFLGDKRTQLVYDVDAVTDAAIIDDIVTTNSGICFAPDTLAEARNRGYRLATA